MKEIINNHIREYRLKSGLSVSQLAFRVGCSRQAIRLFEVGACNPSLRMAKILCDFFGCGFRDLFDFDQSFFSGPDDGGDL